MSIHGEEIFDRLHLKSALRDKNNDARKLLDYTVGEWLDNFTDTDFLEQFYIQNATDKYLDLWGKLFDIPRKLDENDDDYRNRIVYDGIGNLNVDYFINVFNLPLYAYVNNFNVYNNDLTSRNKYYKNNGFMSVAPLEIQQILSDKFLLEANIRFINQKGISDSILDVNGVNILKYYLDVFERADLKRYFVSLNSRIKDVELYLPFAVDCEALGLTNAETVTLYMPNATKCLNMLKGCTKLTSIDLNLPKATNCEGMLYGCSNITEIELNLPSATNLKDICRLCQNLKRFVLNAPSATLISNFLQSSWKLEYVNITIKSNMVSLVKQFFTQHSSDLTNLETLIINGEEVEL